MGAEASRPVQPPEDWEPEGARKAFEVISPVSDISNPSDIHRFRNYHRHEKRTAGRPLQALSKSKQSNNANLPVNRRVSRTVTSTLPVAQKLPRRSSSSNPEIPAPSAFYFPTKETERRLDRVAKSTDNGADQENRFFQTSAPHVAKKTGIRQTIIKKMTACLDDKQDDHVMAQPPHHPHLVQAKLPVAHVVSGSIRGRRSSTSHKTKATTNTTAEHNVPLRKLKQDATKNKTARPRRSSSTDKDPEEKQMSMPSILLHHEDDYFNRLSMSPSSIPAASPFVANNAPANRVTAILDKPSVRSSYPARSPHKGLDRNSMPTANAMDTSMDMVAMTPMSQLVKQGRLSNPVSVDTPIDTPVSDLFSSSNSVPDMNHDNLPGMRSLPVDMSPVSSLMRFYTKTGPMGSSPLSYNSDGGDEEAESQDLKVFSDEQSSSSNQTGFSVDVEENVNKQVPSDEEGGPFKRGSIESQSSLFTNDSRGYKHVDEKKLQLLVHEDKTSSKDISFSLPKEEKASSMSPALVTPGKKEGDDEEGGDRPKMSKLESLFRPILPALSSDDAQSVYSYDHRAIKVTESAPGAIQSSRYISLAGRKTSFSSSSQQGTRTLANQSPSRVSLDSQISHGSTKDMVSDQASSNAEFLFASDKGLTFTTGDPAGTNDCSSVSISTGGARSRLTQRSVQAKEVKVSQNHLGDEETRSLSSASYRSERRVRFSTEVEGGKTPRASVVSTSSSQATMFGHIEVPSESEGRISDLTGSIAASVRSSSGVVSLRSVGEGKMEAVQEEDENCDVSPVRSNGNWGYKDGDSLGVTPHLKGRALKKATNSPFLRFQAAKDKFDSNVAPSGSFAESIDLPDIQSKVSDLSDSGSALDRKSCESVGRNQTSRSIQETIPEEGDEQLDLSPENSIHWAYNEKGVTPYVKGKPVKDAARSPVRRFNDARSKFSSAVITKSPKNVDSIVRRRSGTISKSPKPTKAIVKKGSGGLVSARIEELNARVVEVRKIKRMRKKQANPRLHTHNFDNKQPVRNRALLNYKTSMNTANIERCNSYMAAKFNVIPDVDVDEDESMISGSKFSTDPSPTNSIVSHLTSGTHGTNYTDGTSRSDGTGATVATVVQQRDNRLVRYRTFSESTASTMSSSGFSKVRKQMHFRASEGTKSLSSNDESTTLSAIIHKENEFFPPAALHLSPVQRTPMQAMKWRSLAVAAAQKDARSAKKSNKKLALASRNTNQ
jgi:hypothetical protein